MMDGTLCYIRCIMNHAHGTRTLSPAMGLPVTPNPTYMHVCMQSMVYGVFRIHGSSPVSESRDMKHGTR